MEEEFIDPAVPVEETNAGEAEPQPQEEVNSGEVNLDELAPEVRQLVEQKTKEFQSQWTKKNQQFSRELQESRKKGELLDKILANPKLLEAVQVASGHSTQPQLTQPQQYYPNVKVELPDDQQIVVKELALRAFGERLMPELEPMVRLLRTMEQRMAGLELQSATAFVPDREENLPKLASFFQENPNFMNGKSHEDRIRGAMRALDISEAQNGTKTSAQPSSNGTRQPNNLGDRLLAQTARGGAPIQSRTTALKKGTTFTELMAQLSRETGRSPHEVSSAAVKNLFG